MPARLSLPRRVCRWLSAGVMVLLAACLAGVLLFYGSPASAQTEKLRPVRTRVPAKYPELARRLNLAGTVKLRVVVAPNGHIKRSAPIGGNPLLVAAAMEAVKHWVFEPAKEDTTEVVQFTFAP